DFGVGLGCLGLLLLGLGRTALGRALRATSDDLDTARLLGIDPRRMFALAAGISAATGGVAGVLLAATATFYPTTGSEELLVAFEVVVVGGLGSLRSEEHTSELQSRSDLVCRLLLEKK